MEFNKKKMYKDFEKRGFNKLKVNLLKSIFEVLHDQLINNGLEGIVGEFVFDDNAEIINPFYDESGTEEVNPFDYYGEQILDMKPTLKIKDLSINIDNVNFYAAKIIGEFQDEVYRNCGSTDYMITMAYDDYKVINPFNSIFPDIEEVNPFEYYGKAFIHSKFMKIVNL